VSGRILIVDDDRELCAWLEAGLGAHGFSTTSWTDPAAAAEGLRDADVDVVVTDLNMRGMHGLDLCARVAASRPDVPVVVLTAFGSLESAIGAIRAGAYDFLTSRWSSMS
jgi:two-component system response regulator AtoC